jgi:hypothetical protein
MRAAMHVRKVRCIASCASTARFTNVVGKQSIPNITSWSYWRQDPVNAGCGTLPTFAAPNGGEWFALLVMLDIFSRFVVGSMLVRRANAESPSTSSNRRSRTATSFPGRRRHDFDEDARSARSRAPRPGIHVHCLFHGSRPRWCAARRPRHHHSRSRSSEVPVSNAPQECISRTSAPHR